MPSQSKGTTDVRSLCVSNDGFERNNDMQHVERIHESVFKSSKNRKSLFLLTVAVLCTGLSVMGYMDQASAIPSINLSPPGGPPGTVVTVTGSGFANNTLTSILFDYTFMTEVTTNESGSFSTTVTIPTDVAGDAHRISVNDSLTPVDATFIVTSGLIAISPSKTTSNSVVTVSGSNFGAGKHITLRLDNTNLETIPEIVSSGTGTFSVKVDVPRAAIAKHAIYATDGTITASGIIDVIEDASVRLSSSSGPTGTLVTVTGSGFSADSPLTIKFDSTRLETTPSTITTSSTGSFSAVITIPTGVAVGTNTISAIDASGRSGSAIFAILRSGTVTLTPSAGVGGMSVTIAGSNFEANSPLTIKFDSTRLETTPSTITTSSTGSFSAVITIPTGVAVGSASISATDSAGRTASAAFSITKPSPLTISATTGMSGCPVTISGTTFSPGSIVTVRFDSLTLETSPTALTADASGGFDATVTIPANASVGNHVISVTDTSGRTASFVFIVTTPGVVTLSPSTGPSGTEVIISGSDFANNSRLSLLFNTVGIRSFPSDVLSGATGTFIAKFRIPANITEGSYIISVTDNNGKTGTARFAVTGEGLAVSISSLVGNGGTISVIGGGFAPKVPVTINFDGAIVPTTPGRIATTTGGTFTASFPIPGDATNGNHTITAISGSNTFTATVELKRQHLDDRYGVLINIAPQQYDFHLGDTIMISGEVLALKSGFPLLLKVINPNNAACSFQQLSLDGDMKFKGEPVKLGGTLCSVEGEYKITAFYGKGKAITKFNLVGSGNDLTNPNIQLTGGRAEVINGQHVPDILRYDNKYTIDLDWGGNSVRLRNNVNDTVTFYLMFTEFDADETTKTLTYQEMTLAPFEKNFVAAPFVPHIIDGKANGYLHVFAWTSLDSPKPLHPGLYVPY